MIGLDTNVILRLFDRTNPEQSARAERLVRGQPMGQCYVNLIVLSEFAWTLVRSYKNSRQLVAQRIALLLESPEFTVQSAAEVRRALDRFAHGAMDFPDCVLGEINLSAGCATTMTFDVGAAKGELFSLVAG